MRTLVKVEALSASFYHFWVVSRQFNGAITAGLSVGAAVREHIVTYARGFTSLISVCAVVLMLCGLMGCAGPSASLVADSPPSHDPFNAVGTADLSARFPTTEGQSEETGQNAKPLLFPGADTAAEAVPSSRAGPDAAMAPASFQQAAFVKGDSLDRAAKGDGVEINFDGADVQTVAKFLLGDILQLNFTVDPRVQGTVTLASSGPIPRKDVLPAFESVLRMSNAAIVRTGNLMKIVPLTGSYCRWLGRGSRRTGFRRIAGAVAIYVCGDGGEDCGKLSGSAGLDTRRPVPQSASDSGDDGRAPGGTRYGRDVRRRMAAQSVGRCLSAQIHFARDDDRRA